MTNDVPALFCFFSPPASNRGFKQRFKSRVWSGRGREEGFRGERGGVVDETYISGRHRETWMDKTRMPVNRNIFSLV